LSNAPQYIVGDPNHDQFKKPNTVHCIGENFHNKYTVKDGGVNTYDSWTTEGQDEHKRLVAMARAGRAREHCKELEDWCLEALRKDNGLVAMNMVEERKKKRRKIMPSVPETEEQMAEMWDE
jgi:hypothetical protein